MIQYFLTVAFVNFSDIKTVNFFFFLFLFISFNPESNFCYLCYLYIISNLILKSNYFRNILIQKKNRCFYFLLATSLICCRATAGHQDLETECWPEQNVCATKRYTLAGKFSTLNFLKQSLYSSLHCHAYFVRLWAYFFQHFQIGSVVTDKFCFNLGLAESLFLFHSCRTYPPEGFEICICYKDRCNCVSTLCI